VDFHVHCGEGAPTAHCGEPANPKEIRKLHRVVKTPLPSGSTHVNKDGPRVDSEGPHVGKGRKAHVSDLLPLKKPGSSGLFGR
jgi:hypothetical protein